jgi:hypothetical protein
MKVSGFTFVRNAVSLGFPAVESIRSVLPICDEFVVNIGKGGDGTLELIKSLGEPKIRILETRWNERMQVRGFVYGQQKTIAQYSCTGDWAFYLEADEVLHEDDLDNVYKSMEGHLMNPEVEALVFDYLHFYGNHQTYLDSPAWYRRAPRIIRNSIRSFAPDGLFWVVLDSNKKGRYPRAALSGARIFHYGWVRSEEQMKEKSRQVSKYWEGAAAPGEIRYADVDPRILREFKGTHPAIMGQWLPPEAVPFKPSPGYRLSSRDRRQRIKMSIEKLFGLDLSKRHYRLVSG